MAVTGPLFTGSFELAVDDKGRILVPSDVRREIDEERDGANLMMTYGQNGQRWIYTEAYYREHVAQRIDEPVIDDDLLEYLTDLHSSSRKLAPDKQNRIVLPDDEDYDRESLGREVTLVGNNNHLELWRRDEWREYKASLRRRGPDIAARARQILLNRAAAARAAQG